MRKYTSEYTWVEQKDGSFYMGVTARGLELLNGVSYFEPPEPNREYKSGDTVAVIEGRKSVFELHMPPVKGTAKTVVVNDYQPQRDAWGFTFGLFDGELTGEGLLDEDEYLAMCSKED